ncbi:MAG: single-stranded DNA-binding protein [Phycisphaerae bacterium]|nr:single-stranded DNA-binding protein [Phycisphaerae bacterium]
MANFNKVILAGNLTRDPQLSYTPGNTPVVEFGLAINRKWRGQDGNQREEACFVDLRAYGRQAETLNQYMRKGQPLLVEGRLQYQQWTAQDGSKRSRHMVIVDGFQFLGGGAGSAGGGGGGGGGARRFAGAAADQPPPADDGPPPPEDPPEGDGSGIPF